MWEFLLLSEILSQLPSLSLLCFRISSAVFQVAASAIKRQTFLILMQGWYWANLLISSSCLAIIPLKYTSPPLFFCRQRAFSVLFPDQSLAAGIYVFKFVFHFCFVFCLFIVFYSCSFSFQNCFHPRKRYC